MRSNSLSLLIFATCIMFSICQTFRTRNNTLLRFKNDHTFTILQITDLHYCEMQEKDIDTTSLIKFMMQEAKADFVMVTGDAVSGYAWDGKNQTFYQDCHTYFTSPFKDLDIPYAFILGNHDS